MPPLNRKVLVRWSVLLLVCLSASLGAAWFFTSDGYTGRVQPGAGNVAAASMKPRVPVESLAKLTGKGAGKAGEPAADWPQFLGRERDNRSRETGLLDEWPEKGPEQLWSAKGLGEGYSSVAVSRGFIYTMGTDAKLEYVVALNADDGSEVWRVPIDQKRDDGTGGGPRSTPTVDGDFVYVIGANGMLACLKATHGELVWKKDVLVEFKGTLPGWGICESVLIDGDRLICTPGTAKASLVALNKHSGELIWKSEVPQTTNIAFSSVVPADVGGVRQYVQFLHHALVSVRASDGKWLWSDKSSANGAANCTSPLVVDDVVFSSTGYSKGGAALKLTSNSVEQTTDAKLMYDTKKVQTHHGGMVAIDGYVYASSDPGILVCLELKSGDVKWQKRSVGKGSLTAADGKLILRSEAGTVALVKATPKKYEELAQFEPQERSGRQTWAYPVVAQGKLFLRDQDRLTCYRVK